MCVFIRKLQDESASEQLGPKDWARVLCEWGGGMSMLEHPGGFVNVMRITDEYVRMNVCSELQAGPSGE